MTNVTKEMLSGLFIHWLIATYKHYTSYNGTRIGEVFYSLPFNFNIFVFIIGCILFIGTIRGTSYYLYKP